MNILVNRKYPFIKGVLGELFLDGEFECFTLEDCERMEKISGQTAIPRGIYRMVIDYSQRFKRLMPHILDVPNFTGVRIHSGNTVEDTEGCILVGTERIGDMIGHSREAYTNLFVKLFPNRDDLTIEIKGVNHVWT